MTMEIITIIGTIISANIALAGLVIRFVIVSQNTLRRELGGQRTENQTEFKSIRAENQAEFKSIRELIQTHREENQAEFKKIRAENQAEFKSIRELIQNHREENQAEFKSVRKEMSGLQVRMASVKTRLEDLHDAFYGRRPAQAPAPKEAVAEDPTPYDKD